MRGVDLADYFQAIFKPENGHFPPSISKCRTLRKLCPRKPGVKIKHLNPALLIDCRVVIIRLLGVGVQCLINVDFFKEKFNC